MVQPKTMSAAALCGSPERQLPYLAAVRVSFKGAPSHIRPSAACSSSSHVFIIVQTFLIGYSFDAQVRVFGAAEDCLEGLQWQQRLLQSCLPTKPSNFLVKGR